MKSFLLDILCELGGGGLPLTATHSSLPPPLSSPPSIHFLVSALKSHVCRGRGLEVATMQEEKLLFPVRGLGTPFLFRV